MSRRRCRRCFSAAHLARKFPTSSPTSNRSMREHDATPQNAQLIEPGRHLFQNEANCTRCHKEPWYQDGQNHDVGTGGDYNTPSLRGVGSRRRLLHDGRAFNIEQIFSDQEPKQIHGKVRDLSADEKAALFAYLRSL